MAQKKCRAQVTLRSAFPALSQAEVSRNFVYRFSLRVRLRCRNFVATPVRPVPNNSSVVGSGMGDWFPVNPAVIFADRPVCTNKSATVSEKVPEPLALLKVKFCVGDAK